MTALARIAPRTLAHVLLEVSAAREDFDGCLRWEPDNLGLELACLDRLDALQDEARAMIEAATGVSWTAISGASL